MPPQPNLNGRIHALQITGICGPGAQQTFISRHLTLTYRIDTVSVYFPAGCRSLVQVYLLLCPDGETFTDRVPPGTSLLSMLSPQDYLLGDDRTLTLDINFPVTVKGTWLKAHIVNEDAYPHTFSVLFTIQETEEP